MDNYRAEFVEHAEGMDNRWRLKSPEVFYRKSDRFRTECVAGGGVGDLTLRRPAASARGRLVN
jgi:hypothetical protein